MGPRAVCAHCGRMLRRPVRTDGHPRFCVRTKDCRAAKMRWLYRNSPAVRTYMQEHARSAAIKAYQQEYRQRPEVRARKNARARENYMQPEGRERKQAHQRRYRERVKMLRGDDYDV